MMPHLFYEKLMVGEHMQQEENQAWVSFSGGMHTYYSFSSILTNDLLLLAHLEQ